MPRWGQIAAKMALHGHRHDPCLVDVALCSVRREWPLALGEESGALGVTHHANARTDDNELFIFL